MFNRDKSVIVSWFCAIAFCSSLLFANFGEAATIYIWRDDNGVRQYADDCPPGENCRVKTVGKRRATKLLGKTSTSTTDTSATNTSTTDTSTTSSSNDSTTTTSTDSGTYDTTAGTDTTSTDTTSTDTTSTDTTTADTTDPTATDTGTVVDDSAVLDWDPVVDASLSGYRLFYAMAGTEYQAVDVGNTTTYTMTGLESGKRYYFRVAAYDLSGHQSDFSNEAYKDMP
jgi:hypothetical protein